MTRRMHLRQLLPALLPLALMAAAQAGDIYRWTDAQGRVHYGDQAPPGESQKITEPAPPSALSPEEAQAKLEAIRAQRRQAAEERALAKEKQAKTAAEQAKLAAQCKAARDQLAALPAARRIRDDDGHWYTGDERLQKMRELEASIREHCAGSPAR